MIHGRKALFSLARRIFELCPTVASLKDDQQTNTGKWHLTAKDDFEVSDPFW